GNAAPAELRPGGRGREVRHGAIGDDPRRSFLAELLEVRAGVQARQHHLPGQSTRWNAVERFQRIDDLQQTAYPLARRRAAPLNDVPGILLIVERALPHWVDHVEGSAHDVGRLADHPTARAEAPPGAK